MRAATRVFSLVALIATTLATAPTARAQDDTPGEMLMNARMAREKLARGSAALQTSGATNDTVFLGHSYTDHTGAPGPIVNYWNLYTGTYRPGVNDPDNAVWDWDHSTGFGSYVSDSLAGWWPYVRAYNLTGGLALTDNQRPWWAVDNGNSGNYVINQGAGAKRTKGVVGYWHDDAGVGQAGGSAVTWSPISGSRSAWCGLRQHGDNSAIDLVTGNPYNQTVLEFQNEGDGGSGTNKHFPGYTNQMDQLLYRDIPAAEGNALTISFNYRTLLSTSIVTTGVTRTGWFDKDPLAVTAGNFISSSAAGASAPADSFMVYIGSPVDDASCRYSDGTTAAVYDPQRRWFSEVLRVNEGGAAPYFELLSVSGTHGDTLGGEELVTRVVPGSVVDAILGTAGNPGRVRLVFRVKTNQSFSDADSRASNFTSRGHGAAIVDDVTYQIAAGPVVVFGDFETPQQGGLGSIDNRTSESPVTHWKSTGKPPAIYFHARALSELTYAELCGPPDSPARECNLSGVVIAAGNADDDEHQGDRRYAFGREVQHGFMSPTVNLVTPLDGSPNVQGLTTSMVEVTDDIYVFYDIYAGMFNLQFTGNAWTYGVQSFPALQTLTAPLVGNRAAVWGAPRVIPGQIFNPEPQCFQDLEPFFSYGVVGTSNPSGVPDSVRCFLGINQQCFRFAISLGCNSADGAYFDNVALAFIDLPASAQTSAASAVTLGSMNGFIWNFYNDAFPANETPGLPGSAAFDTCGAWLQTGINNYPNTGDALRNDIPGDTMVVSASNATVSAPDDPSYAQVRVDLVFRVLPGPGNFQIAAGRNFPPDASMNLLNVPSDQASVVVPGSYDPSPSAGARNFFASYIAKPGAFAKGDHHGNLRWDHLTWNSARCDTAELNRFPVTGIGVGSGLTAATYASMYHEEEFLPGGTRPELGIPKNKCFLLNPAINSVNHTNITCSSVPGWVTSGAPGNGYNGSPTTAEFTKIIPDGLLTPGAHVQYFFRKSHAIDPLLSFAMVPDTNLITPQSGEGLNLDGHRWQQFGILPDRWKDPAFDGMGMACMLLVDGNDRRGNERVWVSVMDSIGGTIATDRGNHNGWGGVPDSLDYTGMSVSDPRLAPYIVSNKNKNAGTAWDMYGVKAAESYTTSSAGLGNRLANQAIGFAAGKDARMGPTPEMLRAYYRLIVYLSGDLNTGILGPFSNRSQNDIAILEDFLRSPLGTAQPRGLFAIGSGFAQSLDLAGGFSAVHPDFLELTLGTRYRGGAYPAFSGNTSECAELHSTASISSVLPRYAVLNDCDLYSNDVLELAPGMPETGVGFYYENVGVNGPYVAGVIKHTSGPRPWTSLTLGVDLEDIRTQYCATTRGRVGLFYNTLSNVFGSLCRPYGEFLPTLDAPGTGTRDLLAASLLLKGNVQREGPTQVVFTSPGTQRIRIDLHDVAGRRVRTLADRVFRAGEHTLTWDGAADDGTRAARGVYFLRMAVEGDSRELMGRVVVLR